MWHPEVSTDAVRRVLASIAGSLGPEWYLAGGTGLALQLGHRRSHDLDFFAPALFAEELAVQRFNHATQSRKPPARST